MKSPAFSRKAFLFPIVAFRKILIAVTVLLAAACACDYMFSGDLRIENVGLHDHARGQDSTIMLPLVSLLDGYTAGGQYSFTLRIPDNFLNRVMPLRLVPHDCIRELKINGAPYPLSIFNGQNLCDPINGVSITAAHVPPDSTLEVMVDGQASRPYGLQLVRTGFFTDTQRLLLLAVAAYATALAGFRNWRQCRSLHYSGLLALLFLLSANLVDWRTIRFFLASGIAIASVVFFSAFWPPAQRLHRRIDALLRRIFAIPPAIFISVCVLAFFILAGSLSQLLFDGVPHIADTHVQYMQSKIFAEGKLYEASHPLAMFFDFQNAVNDGKYYSITFPGNPMLLAIGQLLGVPWLLNPVMGALTVWAIFLLAREIGGKSTGYIAAGLMLISPAIIFMSSEYMNHAACMLFLMVFLYAYIRMCKTGDWRWAALAGCAAGYALLIRVQSTVPFALPVALHVLWRCIRNPKIFILPSAVMTLGFNIAASFLLYYNFRTTGDPLHPAYINFSRNHMLWDFLSASRWNGIIDDLHRAIEQTVYIHADLFGWPASSLSLVFLLLLLKKLPPYAGLLLGCFIGQFLALVFIYPDGGTIMPPRYIYESFGCLIILSALGIEAVAEKLAKPPKSILETAYARSVPCMTIAILAVLALPYSIIPLYRYYQNNYWEGNWGYYYMLTHTVETPAVVFIEPYEVYRWVFFAQPPFDNSPIIFARELGDEDQKLMDYYPARHVYKASYWHVQKIR